MARYACPKCEYPLIYWEEFVIERSKYLSVATGKTVGNSHKGPESPLGTYGLRCSNCGFTHSLSYPAMEAPEDIEWREKTFGDVSGRWNVTPRNRAAGKKGMED